MHGSSTTDQVREVFRLLDELERCVCALSPSSAAVDLILQLRNELIQTLAKAEKAR